MPAGHLPDPTVTNVFASTPPNIDLLRQRAELLKELRLFFDTRGFFEVQPPCLSRDCVVDPYIDPIVVGSRQLQVGLDLPPNYYLQTSPESAMKRLLAAGSPSIYSIGPVFRAGERGQLHNPEFTMLEWYDVGANITQAIELLTDLASDVLQRTGCDVVNYRQLFVDVLGFDPLNASLDVVQQQVVKVDPSILETESQDRDFLLDVLLSELIQPALGFDRPVIIKNYPASQAALARPAADDDQCAARFELFANGIELANGYDELQDAEVLLRRAADANQKRTRTGRSQLEVDSSLIDAMRVGLPACAGVALGVDRLLMVRTGVGSIEQVIPFPIEIA
jgi:elongation factor P--(R)-beta-lysine ligase